MGAWASEIFQEQGGKVLAVSDAFGAIHNENGLNIKALRKHIADGKALKDFPEGMRPAAAPQISLDVQLHRQGMTTSALF